MKVKFPSSGYFQIKMKLKRSNNLDNSLKGIKLQRHLHQNNLHLITIMSQQTQLQILLMDSN